jgi:cytochrome b6-f complex iron-sulfur subunit
MSAQPYGEVHGPPVGEMSRRTFMRRVLGLGVGILTLEFLAGTLDFLWPNIRSGLGGKIPAGTAKEIVTQQAEWATGLPFPIQPARAFLVNVPAAKSLVDNPDNPKSTPDPGDKVGPKVAPVDASVLALYRKCPHLGCQVPQLCDSSHWFECLCHGSKYTVLGEKRDGPAPRGMDRFNVTIENGAYVIDTSELVAGPPIGTDTFDDRTPTQLKHCTG